MRVISQYIVTADNAGPKAKKDIEKILNEKYNAKICTYKIKESKHNVISKYLFMLFNFKKNDLSIMQLPFTSKIKMLNKIRKKIGIIHDSDGMRTSNLELLKKEVEVYNTFDVLIVHNDAMLNYLKNAGVVAPMIPLYFFDYLDSENVNNAYAHKENLNVIYPGNLEKGKADFLYELSEKKMKFNINAYGKGFEKCNNKKITYRGSFSPEELPHNIKGDLGLIWSGKLDDSDNNIGEKGYNRYNYPHKLSCYIVAQIPVVVWSKAAVADVVQKYNIGYVIDNLYDINSLDLKDYDIKKANIVKLSDKIKTGEYTSSAIDKALKIIGEK
jgi:hypothetical protein